MKRLSRMIIFSALSLFLLTLWNKGVTITFDPKSFLIVVVAIAALYYILTPLSKIILFPLNLLTFGLFSIALNGILFALLVRHFSAIISIKEWVLPHVQFYFLNFGPAHITWVVNIAICSLFIYLVINLLEKIL